MRPARASAQLFAITAYAGSDQSPLPAVRATLATWISALRRADGGAHEVHALLDPEEHLLRRAVGRCLRQAAPDERLLLYICGRAALARQPYLLGQDSDLRDLPGTGLPLGVLAELLQGCVAHEVLLLIDAHFPPGAEPGARELSALRRSCGPSRAAVVLTRPDILEGIADPPSALGALLDGVSRGDIGCEAIGLNLTDALRHFRRLGRRRGALGGLHVLGGPPPSGVGLVPVAPERSSGRLGRWIVERRRGIARGPSRHAAGWGRWARLAPALGILPLTLVALLGVWALIHGAPRHPGRLVAAVEIARAGQTGSLPAPAAPQASQAISREAPAGPYVIQHIDSSPAGARVTYVGPEARSAPVIGHEARSDGVSVQEAITPAELQLPRSSEPLIIQVDKAGYLPERLVIVADVPRSHFVALRQLDHQEKAAPIRSVAPPSDHRGASRVAVGPPAKPPISPPISPAARLAQHKTATEVNDLLDGFLEVRLRGCCRAAGPGACSHLMAEVSVLPSGKLGTLRAYLEPPHGRAEICIREVVRSALRREFSGFSGPSLTFERTYNFDSHSLQPR